MTSLRSASPRPLRSAVAVVVVLAALALVPGYRLLAPSSSADAAADEVPPPVAAVVPDADLARGRLGAPGGGRGGIPRMGGRALGAADGAVPAGTSVFADEVPGVGKLEPRLRQALRRAAEAAAADGVRFEIDSGWRSREYQAQLLRQAVAKYGSERAAARWVATPDTSAHVSGEAVDVGPDSATAWLRRHGAAHGLCQIYRNEPWHYELRPDAARRGCPPMYPDPSHDPRMMR